MFATLNRTELAEVAAISNCKSLQHWTLMILQMRWYEPWLSVVLSI
ncbi:hypothetical protein AM1_H0051 (plasmid) [Acaryochloris marina MBIC11017]|uniref:Uncharacterized protein n=1 Tax=Acaryochloris marina (strain MBIC 11017) TaxID=329726 RepID=A8ZQW5_ACAM1|nr:hypothetical protein AM1_H0051 [Acaryochloris marina MBIC11017]